MQSPLLSEIYNQTMKEVSASMPAAAFKEPIKNPNIKSEECIFDDELERLKRIS